MSLRAPRKWAAQVFTFLFFSPSAAMATNGQSNGQKHDLHKHDVDDGFVSGTCVGMLLERGALCSRLARLRAVFRFDAIESNNGDRGADDIAVRHLSHSARGPDEGLGLLWEDRTKFLFIEQSMIGKD